MFHTELRGLDTEGGFDVSDIALNYWKTKFPYMEVDVEDLDLNFGCQDCMTQNTPCGCTPEKMN
jgi:hypothetical protein